MNGLKKLAKGFKGKNKTKNLIISIVILIEVISLLTVATFAWVETVSSIKITNEANTVGTIKDDTKYTDMLIGDKPGTIDLLDYFEPSGDMHLAPASSADGKTLYFPKANIGSNVIYRKGNVSDKNTTYLSASFRLKADTNADFFFWKDSTHSISVDDNIRVSVTAYTEGENPEGTYDPESGKLISNTKIYANNASTTAVVNSTSGATGATTVEAFSDHQKGAKSEKRLFAVGANETKYVTINVWLQKSTENNDDITTNMSVAKAINNLGITSSLTPRHVTLLPTPTWDSNGATFYAWCWDAPNSTKSRLYKLELDENEHYSFDYNGTFRKTVFVRAVPGCTVRTGEYDSDAWPFSNKTTSGTDGYWNQTTNTTIPNDPVDPTYIIETINGGTDSKSTGSWHDPATVKVALCTGQGGENPWGTLEATSYVGVATTSHEIESTDPNSQKHKDTVHAWPGKILQLKATAKSGYAFVGWYLDAAGTTPAPTVNSTANTASIYKPNAPSTASEITYYAKFKETRTLTILRTVDGNQASSVAAGKITVNGSSTTNTGTSKSVTVDKGASVSFSATAATGYTFQGFYTTKDGNTTASSPVTLNGDNPTTTYYARFTTNTHTVQLNRIGTTGNSTVQYGNETAAASVTKTDVKYNSSVTIKANPAAGYEFVGWYTNPSGTGTAESTDASYSFTLGDADVTYYAKFKAVNIYLTGWINGAAVTTGQTALKFSSSGTANEYTLNYTFTGNQGGYQYVTIYDGANVYHPATHESGSGVAADLTKTDKGPNNDPKWKVNATSHDVVTFTWNNSTKTLSWSITKYYYFDCSSCSWFKNDGCVPAVSYNYGAYQPATLVSGSLYRVAIPEDVTTFSLARHNSSGDYNAFNITKSGTNNKYNINSNCNGGSWTTY